MRHLVELSGESRELAAAEVRAIAGDEETESDGRALIVQSGMSGRNMVSRLALAHSVSEYLFSCGHEELERLLQGINLPGNTFRVRTSRLGDAYPPEEGAGLARHMGEMLSGRYRVDLERPDSEVRVLMASKFHVGILCGEIDRTAMESRKSENRPYKHPISLHPKLARALVNLTRVECGQEILDPFCGTGGILLEAGLMGCKVLGGDIDERMVSGTVCNLEHYGVREKDIRQMDVSAWPRERGQVDAIATDPPYGRSASTAREAIEHLYARSFESFRLSLKDGGRLAIALPEERHAALARGFVLEGMYPVRVHRSLTRFFCIFRKSPS